MTAAGLALPYLWPSEKIIGYIVLAIGLLFLVLAIISYTKDCSSPINLLGIEPLPLSETQLGNILLEDADLLSAADQGNSLFGKVWVTDVLLDRERTWLRRIAELLRRHPQLKSQILGDVFIPMGTSVLESFKMRIAARMTRINLLTHSPMDGHDI